MRTIAELAIEGLPKMTNAQNIHWRQRHSETKNWKNTVEIHCAQAKILGLNLTKAKLTLIRHSTKEPDCDGLTSGFKSIIDGLKQARVIVDDKPSIIGSPTYLWKPAKQKQGFITIKIEVDET